MKKLSDGIPEPIVISERTKPTREFCAEQNAGRRCTLVKGHSGMHESVASAGIARWQG
jgi:hypothetical protein